MSPRESASWVPKCTSSESIEHPIVTTGIPRKTYIKCSQIHNSIQSNNSETSKVKLNSSQEGRGGETPYDSTIVTKLAVHQDRAKSRTRERGREIKHIATGTYPQPRGWTTPSSSWRALGWWRWPPVMIPPSGWVPEKGPDWFLVVTKACGSRNPDLGFFSGVSIFIGIFGVGFTSRG